MTRNQMKNQLLHLQLKMLLNLLLQSKTLLQHQPQWKLLLRETLQLLLPQPPGIQILLLLGTPTTTQRRTRT